MVRVRPAIPAAVGTYSHSTANTGVRYRGPQAMLPLKNFRTQTDATKPTQASTTDHAHARSIRSARPSPATPSASGGQYQIAPHDGLTTRAHAAAKGASLKIGGLYLIAGRTYQGGNRNHS